MLTNPLDASGAGTLSDLLNKIISYLTMISIPIITIMALYGGFQMLLAQDNAKKFEEGMKTLKHAALGAAVVIVADGVLYIVQSVLSLT
ncbi:MAG: pilin [Candidatus Paceibacterota bacterium]